MEKTNISIDDLVAHPKVSDEDTTARILRNPPKNYLKAHNSRVSAGLHLKNDRRMSKEEIFEVFDRNVPCDYDREHIGRIIDSIF